MPTVKELKEFLENEFQEDDVVAWSIWTTEDVHAAAYEEGCPVSEKRAEEVLNRIHKEQDAEFGINWDAIREML